MSSSESPASLALTALSAALDQLVATVEDGALDHLDADELVGFLQRFERVRNRMALVDHRALQDAEQRGLAETLCQGRLTRVLTQALSISTGEATRRVRAAEQLGRRRSPFGQPLPPARPVLAAASGPAR